MISLRGFLFSAMMLLVSQSFAQENYVSKVWVADNGDGTYKNPVLNADYSDPDAIRVGDNFYMVSSSFTDMPGLPILQSKDLVNWKLIGHALKKLPPYDIYNKPQHGNGVWAPSIRYHNNEFYIYFPDPDYGIYVIKTQKAEGPWSEPVLVTAGKGLEDPCPLWDDDGQAYMVHAYAGSRAGIKSVLVLKKLNKAGDKVIDDGVIVYDGHKTDPTIEGPKLYKRNGYYYIFAPAGGVSTGWQVVLRAKNIYGPYERKEVMDQGHSLINGPHQGAWVTTQTDEDWFLHFQDRVAYGRVVHLQPMHWVNDWPIIGTDRDGDGKGEPVVTYKKPNVGETYPIETPAESDEFNNNMLGLQWQWMANPQPAWSFMNSANGTLRLYSYKADSVANLWFAPNVLLQKFPAEEFRITTKLTFKPNLKLEHEKAGLVIMGMSYADIAIESRNDGNYMVYSICKDADKGNAELETVLGKATGTTVYFRVRVTNRAHCRFSYSLDGQHFTDAGDEFIAVAGKWIGAKAGLFCTRQSQTNDSGWADVDWFRVEKL